MIRYLAIAGLWLRLWLAWWAIPSLFAVLLSDILALLLAFFVFPLTATVLATVGTVLQLRGTRTSSLGSRLGAFHHTLLSLPLTPTDAEAILAEIVQNELVATEFELKGHQLHAGFRPPAWSGRLARWIRTDELHIAFRPLNPERPEGVGCALELRTRPLSRLLYGLLWVDQGRNLHRFQSLQSALTARQAALSASQEAASRSGSLEARLAQAELLLLRAQVEPHFLFNTLAHLRELVRVGENTAALEMVDHLIAHSRSLSNRIRQATHPLEQELEATRAYLALMQLRFPDRLRVEVQADPDTLPCEVPVGVLSVPAENAIKHGIEPLARPGLVQVRCCREDGRLVLEVRDDGPGLPPQPDAGRGTGLANLRERLALAYDREAQLLVEDHEEGGVQVRVTLPVQTPSA